MESSRHSQQLIGKVKHLRANYRPDDVIRLLEKEERAQLVQEPELLLALAASLADTLRIDDAVSLLREGKPFVVKTHDSRTRRRWCLISAYLSILSGEIRGARRITAGVLSSAESSEDARAVATASNLLGITSSYLGEVDQALLWYARSGVVWARLGEPREVGATRHNAGKVLRSWGRPAEAIPHLAYAEEYFENFGSQAQYSYVRAERGLLWLALGDRRMARRLIEGAARVGHATLIPSVRAYVGRASAVLEAAEGQIEPAIRQLEEAQGRAIPASLTLAEITEDLAVLAAIAGRPEEAEEYYHQAERNYLAFGSARSVGRLRRRLQDARSNGSFPI